MPENNNYKCYQQGYCDTCTTLGDKVPPTMLVDDPVDEDSDAFERVAYLQGQVNALVEHVKHNDKANTGAVPRRGSDVGTSPLLAVSDSERQA
jgi:hypothetical protein